MQFALSIKKNSNRQNNPWSTLALGETHIAWKTSVFGIIQFECGKMRTRITPNTDTFYAVSGKGFFFWKYSNLSQIVEVFLSRKIYWYKIYRYNQKPMSVSSYNHNGFMTTGTLDIIRIFLLVSLSSQVLDFP